jgi:predicted phosphodiesterase
LETNFEKVVLLGDIWETLTAKTPGMHAAELKAAEEHHREIFERFQRPQYHYVHGNHDFVAGRTRGAPDELKLNDSGVSMLFSHGHQGDVLCMQRKWLSELGVWLGAWIRRFGLQPVYSYFAAMERERSSDRGGECVVKQWALAHADERKVDIVVTGHTHVAAKSEDGGRLFLNSGSCANGHISFLSMDTRRGHYGINTSY